MNKGKKGGKKTKRGRPFMPVYLFAVSLPISAMQGGLTRRKFDVVEKAVIPVLRGVVAGAAVLRGQLGEQACQGDGSCLKYAAQAWRIGPALTGYQTSMTVDVSCRVQVLGIRRPTRVIVAPAM